MAISDRPHFDRADADPTASQGVEPTRSDPPPTIRARAILLGLVLLPINAYWLVMMEAVRYSAHPTTQSLFFNAVFILSALTALNVGVRRMRASWALNQVELLLIYSMVCIGSCMAGHDFGQVLVPSLAWPFAQAQPGNSYASFQHLLPAFAMAPDTKATADFFIGGKSLYTRDHIMAWLPATITWTGFVTVLLWVMTCVNVLIRKHWTDHERLTYPLVKIPLEVTAGATAAGGGTPLLRNRLFWIGFLIAAGIDMVNSLNYYYPSIPPILTPGNGQSFLDLSQFVTTKPWNAIGWTPLSTYPFAVGFGMMLPLDFLFSSWFFYVIWKLQSVMTVAMAWDADSRMPYANYQAFGAYLLFFVSTIWLSRHYLAQVMRKAMGKTSSLDDSDEPLRYRTALLGLAGGLIVLVLVSMRMGLGPGVALAFFIVYLALALAITRMRAEMGTPVHDLHFTGPDWTITDLLGPRTLGPGNLAGFSLFFWFNRAYRSHPMPFQLEGMKMAEASGAIREMRKWMWCMLLAGAVGMVCAFWAVLHTGYVYGSHQFGNESWDRLSGWLRAPQPPNHKAAWAVVVGFIFAAFLQTLRASGVWCPFHPLAYAVSGSWEMNLFWMPLFIAWIIKGLLLRYGGGMTYQKAMPFFYGLILGEFIPGSILNIYGIVTNTPVYQFWQ